MATKKPDLADVETTLATIPEDAESDGVIDPRLFKASNGILFRVRPVSALLVMEAKARIPVPVPPKIRIEDKETWEENIHDPAYHRAIEEYQYQIGQTTNAILITRGTELVSTPEEIEGLDTDGWADDMRDFAGIDVPAVGTRRRYFLWVKYVALVTLDDWRDLVNKIQEASGQTREDMVAAAAESFRPDEEGNPNPGLRIVPENGRGN